jgi:hypothetical protein
MLIQNQMKSIVKTLKLLFKLCGPNIDLKVPLPP